MKDSNGNLIATANTVSNKPKTTHFEESGSQWVIIGDRSTEKTDGFWLQNDDGYSIYVGGPWDVTDPFESRNACDKEDADFKQGNDGRVKFYLWDDVKDKSEAKEWFEEYGGFMERKFGLSTAVGPYRIVEHYYPLGQPLAALGYVDNTAQQLLPLKGEKVDTTENYNVDGWSYTDKFSLRSFKAVVTADRDWDLGNVLPQEAPSEITAPPAPPTGVKYDDAPGQASGTAVTGTV